MATWNSRGLRGSTLEDMVNRTNDRYAESGLVKNFDPKVALFSPDENGIEFYSQIIEGAPNCLKPNGFVAFELGINQADLVKKMLEKDFKNIEITKDLAGIERVITAQLK